MGKWSDQSWGHNSSPVTTESKHYTVHLVLHLLYYSPNLLIMKSKDTHSRQVFPEPPVISFKRCPTLNDKLVHSYLPGDSQKTCLDHKPKSSFKCNQCNHCSNIAQNKYFVDTASKMEYYVKHLIYCKTTHVIYRLECPQCKVFYIRRTKRHLQDRLAEHK